MLIAMWRNRATLITILKTLTLLLKKVDKVNTTVDQVQAEVASLNRKVVVLGANQTKLLTLTTGINTALADVRAQLAALQGQQNPDLQPVIDGIKAVEDQIDAENKAVLDTIDNLTATPPASGGDDSGQPTG